MQGVFFSYLQQLIKYLKEKVPAHSPKLDGSFHVPHQKRRLWKPNMLLLARFIKESCTNVLLLLDWTIFIDEKKQTDNIVSVLSQYIFTLYNLRCFCFVFLELLAEPN